MPELPEVETVARTLEPLIQGRTISRVLVPRPSVWEGELAPSVLERRAIAATGRRGKLLLVHFTPDAEPDDNSVTGIAFHLKMTGRVFVYPAGTEPGKHTRLVLDLDDGNQLFFDDMRTFGYVRAMSAASLLAWPFWQSLGPEPLDIEPEAFVRLFDGRRRTIKAALLDQTVLAGVGNIYADESLFRAGIRPDAHCSRIDQTRLLALHRHLVAVLRESIEACGSSIRDYRTARGDAGAFQNAFTVYGRGGQACVNCGCTLSQSKIAGRTTVWCEQCQS